MTRSLEPTDSTKPAVQSELGVLPRRLGVPGLVMLIVAFCAPIATMAGFQQLAIGFGNGIGAPVSFLVAGAILLIFAVGFVGMSKYVENPGAFYCYVVDGIGKAPGLAGGFVATVAYLLIAAGSYVYQGLIIVDMTQRLFGAPVWNWQIWTVVSIIAITGLGLLRIDLSMKVLGVLVLVECAVVGLWEVAIWVQGGPEGYSPASWTPTHFFSGSVGLGIIFAMLTMIGIETGACFRDETRDPDRSVGRGTYIAIAFLAVFYALGTWAYIISQGASHVVDEALNDPVGSFFASIDHHLGAFFVNLATIVLVTSQMASLNALQGAASRYLFALGRDRVLPKALARVHAKLESPYVAVLAVTGICVVIVLAIFVTGIDAVAAYASLTGAGIYFLLPLLIATSVAVLLYFRRHRELSVSRWVSVIAPAISTVALSGLFVLTSFNLKVLAGTEAGAIGAMIGLVAVIAFGYLLGRHYKKAKPDVYERIGHQ